MTYHYLEEIQSFLEKRVLNEIKLKKPSENSKIEHFELVNPKSYIGWDGTDLNSPVGRAKVPAVIIGIDNTISYGGDTKTIPISLALVCYNGGTINDSKELIFDNSGFADILNLGDLIMRKLLSEIIAPDLVIESSEIKFSPDSDAFGDYWLGTVNFTVSADGFPISKDDIDLL